MRYRFKSRKKLKKNPKFILTLIVLMPLIIYMHNNKILKQLFMSCASNLIDKNVFKTQSSFESKITSIVFSSPVNEVDTNINNDEIFMVKEEKSVEPIVYLYNTHQTEEYKKLDGTEFKPNIIIATQYLKEKLDEKGIYTLHEKRSVSDMLLENNWSYGSSYKVSRTFIDSAVSEHPSIKYLFDIHRDSGNHEYTTLCINTKCYAKILFLIGLENSNYKENQVYAEELSKRLNNKVNGISKGILQKQGPKVNGVYNEDFSNRTILIEVGGENNTIDEVYNTVDVLSEVISEYIKEEYYGK